MISGPAAAHGVTVSPFDSRAAGLAQDRPFDSRAGLLAQSRSQAYGAMLGRIVPRIVWTFALLTAVAGAAAGIGVTIATNGPPHEAAAMALAYLLVLAPYLFVARAVDQLMR